MLSSLWSWRYPKANIAFNWQFILKYLARFSTEQKLANFCLLYFCVFDPSHCAISHVNVKLSGVSLTFQHCVFFWLDTHYKYSTISLTDAWYLAFWVCSLLLSVSPLVLPLHPCNIQILWLFRTCVLSILFLFWSHF